MNRIIYFLMVLFAALSLTGCNDEPEKIANIEAKLEVTEVSDTWVKCELTFSCTPSCSGEYFDYYILNDQLYSCWDSNGVGWNWENLSDGKKKCTWIIVGLNPNTDNDIYCHMFFRGFSEELGVDIGEDPGCEIKSNICHFKTEPLHKEIYANITFSHPGGGDYGYTWNKELPLSAYINLYDPNYCPYRFLGEYYLHLINVADESIEYKFNYTGVGFKPSAEILYGIVSYHVDKVGTYKYYIEGPFYCGEFEYPSDTRMYPAPGTPQYITVVD